MNSHKRGFIYLTITNILFIIVGYFINIFLARRLGPSDYGVYGVLTSLMTALNILQVSGVPQSVSKFIAEKKENADAILSSGFKLQLVATLGIGFLLYIASDLVASIFNDSAFVNYSKLMALIFPVYGIFALYTGYYNGLHNFKRQALLNALYIMSKLILVIGLTIFYGIYGIIIGFVISPFIALLGGFKRPNLSDYFPYKKIILYSLPLVVFACLSTLQITLDIFFLKAIAHNPAQTGYYAAAQNIAIVPYFALSAIGVVLMPNISRLVSSNRLKEAENIISNSFRYLLFLLIPTTLIIGISAPALLNILFGNKYLPAISPLRILLVGYILLTIFSMMANILNGAGRAKYSMYIAACGVLISLIFYIILIPITNTVGAAISTLIGISVTTTFSIIYVYRIFHFNFSMIEFLKILLSCTVILVGLKINLNNIWLLLIYFITSLCSYVAILVSSGAITKSEYFEFKQIISSHKWLLSGR
jgi:stage V sporulation protein B